MTDDTTLPCVVRDSVLNNPHFVIRDAGSDGGLQASRVLGARTLEAVMPDGGNPPGQNGAGYNGRYTANAGFGILRWFYIPAYIKQKVLYAAETECFARGLNEISPGGSAYFCVFHFVDYYKLNFPTRAGYEIWSQSAELSSIIGNYPRINVEN